MAEAKKESKDIKKSRRIWLILLVIFVIGPGLTYAVLRNSRVQTFLVQGVAAYLSTELETNVEIGGLDVSFFLNVVFEDVSISDRQGDDLLFADRMILDVGRISWRKRKLNITKISLDQASLHLLREQDRDEYNVQFLLDYFASNDPSPSGERKWDVVCRSLDLRSTSFSHQDNSRDISVYGFDPNHFSLKDLNLAVNDIHLIKDELRFALDFFSFQEAGGFRLNHLSGEFALASDSARAENVLFRSPDSEVAFSASFSYDGYDKLANFYEDVHMSMDIEPSVIDLADLGYFISPLYGLEQKLTFYGQLNGSFDDLRGKNVSLSYGSNTSLTGDFYMSGLPDISDAHLQLQMAELVSSAADIASFRMPLAIGGYYPQLPESVYRLGVFSFAGNLSGTLDQVNAEGQMFSELGSMTARLVFGKNAETSLYTYKGEVNTPGFQLGTFFAEEALLGSISLDAQLEGEGLTLETLDVMLSGTLDQFDFFDYSYENISIAGQLSNRTFNGELLVRDPNIHFDFSGEINLEEKVPLYDFSVRLDEANLTRLNVYQRDTLFESILSADISINARFNNIDDLAGQLIVDGLVYGERTLKNDPETEDRLYDFGSVAFSNEVLDDGSMSMQIKSDQIDGDLIGYVNFSSLGRDLGYYFQRHMPSLFPNGSQIFLTEEELGLQDVFMDIRLKDTEMITALFLPSVSVSPYAHFSLVYNSAQQIMHLYGSADTLTVLGSELVDWELEGFNNSNGIQLSSASSKLRFSDTRYLENTLLQGHIFKDTLAYGMFWDGLVNNKQNHGQIEGLMRFYDPDHAIIRFLPSYAVVNDSLWQLNIDHEIYIDSARVEIHNLMIYNNRQFVKADGVIGPASGDRMNLSFNEFDFANLDMLIRAKNVDFDGIMSGSVSFAAFMQPLSIESALLVNNFAFNSDLLGDMMLNSTWDTEEEGFSVDARVLSLASPGLSSPMVVTGYVYPEREHDQFDLDILLDQFKLSVFSRYMENFADRFRGMASGRMRLEGPFSSPELSGRIKAVDAGMHFGYLNTTYSFSNEVDIGKNYFRFDNLLLTDTLGNTGLTNGEIRHNNFKDFYLDLRIQPERMVMLNTTAAQNEFYYGSAFASGMVHIYGPGNNIVMDISARTNRGTQIILPLYYTGELVENRFITFVSKDTTTTEQSFPVPKLTGVSLNFDLEITPEAEIQLYFDSQIGDAIRARGSGNLAFEVAPSGAFNMYGDFNIEDGDYLFTLQNLINKRFRIEQGGNIRWTGNLYDADVDLRAAYRLRTSLYDLVMDVDTSEVYRRRIPVETVLILEDKLFNPAISFDIQLPAGDESTRELVERMITTEQEMNRQVFSLLVLNRFMPTTPDQYNTALGYGVGSTSSELLSNQLSNWLSQISSEFDIGINYRPGDEISSQELEVALSTQFFDDRVLIDGQLGVAGNNPATTQRASNIIGDVNIEVKITPEGKFRIKAFNRSNTFDVTNANSPYTQGIGVFYRKEFDSLGELLKPRRRLEVPPPNENDTENDTMSQDD